MAISKLSLKDNQEYRLVQQDSGEIFLHSDYDAQIGLLPKKWSTRAKWLPYEEMLQMAFSKNELLLVSGEEDYEHTADFFIQTGWKNGCALNLFTSNLIGCARFDNLEVEVGSRFGNKFLKYIIADADGFLAVPELGSEADSPTGYYWLLAFLWSSRLRHAYRLGLPKKYLSECERLNFIRGEIDPVDFNIGGATGTWKCTYRNLSYNTPAAGLFYAAYRIIRQKPECAVFSSDVHNICQTFLQATSEKRLKLKELLKVPYFTNAFYSEYNKVIDLSKSILKFWGSDYSGTNQSEAIFFDVAMLFEFYIRRLLLRNGFSLRNKLNMIRSIPTAPLAGDFTRKLIPDLVFDLPGGIGVFDVKYKFYDKNYGVSREDLFQLHTYIGQYGNDESIRICGFVYPIKESRWRTFRPSENIEDVFVCQNIKQQDRDIPFAVGFIVVPDDVSTITWSDFNAKMFKWTSLFVGQMQLLSGLCKT